MSLAHLKVYDFTKGINRTFSQLELPDGYVRDAKNLLPRIPGGVQAIKGDTVVSSAITTPFDDIFPYYSASGTFYWVGRGSSGIFTSTDGVTWSALSGTTVTAVSGGLHSMCLYRGSLAIAEEGQTIKLWDGATVTSLTAGPYGGLVAEFAGCLCNLGESTAPTFPGISLPMTGTGVPLTANTTLATGQGTIASNVVTPSPAPSWTINAYAGKLVTLGGSQVFRVASNTETTFTVTSIDGAPADSTSTVPFVISSATAFMEVYPSGTVDLGQAQLNADSDPVSIRIHNRAAIPVSIAAIRAKGADFKISELPALPASVPPGGTFAFKVVMNPFSKGTVSGTVIIEHDLFAQSSMTVQLTGTGVTTAVLVTPTSIDFGEWIAGTTSAPIKVQIKNTLREPVTISALTAPSSPFAGPAAYSAASTYAVGDTVTYGGTAYSCVTACGPEAWTSAHWSNVIQPDGTMTFQVTFTPASAGTATGTLVATRTMAARRSRLRMSKPLDATTWDHDSDWISVEEGDTFTGNPVAMVNYDDGLVIFKESEIGVVLVGGEFSYMYRQLTLGKGIGAMVQQAICGGNGSIFWIAKTGIFQMSGQNVEPIHLPIDDVVKIIAASDFPQVRACFYDNCYIFTAPLPTGFIGDSVDKATWAYHVPTQSWWRLDGTATAYAVKRGTSDKPVWYAFYPGTSNYTFAKRDDSASATVNFSVGMGYLSASPKPSTIPGMSRYVYNEPSVIKTVESAVIHTDNAGQFADGGFVISTDNGDKVKGIVDEPTNVVLYCGIGTCSGGTLTDTDLSLDTDEVKDYTLEINNATYTISGNAGNTISYPGAESGKFSYVVSAANPSAVIPVPVYFRECFGGSFSASLSGAKSSTTLGNIYFITLSMFEIGERVGEPGR